MCYEFLKKVVEEGDGIRLKYCGYEAMEGIF